MPPRHHRRRPRQLIRSAEKKGTGVLSQPNQRLPSPLFDLIPVTLNHGHFDPSCPIRVVHREPAPTTARTALALNWTWAGQTTAVVLGAAA